MGALTWWVGGQGFKPRDVEEPIDYYWHRPLAARLVRLLVPLPVTPNQVTYASGFVSLLSGAALSLGAWYDRHWAAVGAALLLASIVLDCADGQLARVRGTSSAVGRALDGLMDAVAPLAVFHGMAFYLLAQGYGAAVIWPVGLCAGGSLIWHASQYDVNKNIYLHGGRPEFSLGGKTLVSVADMEAFSEEYEQRGERWNALLMRVWAFWTRPQIEAMAMWLDDAISPRNDTERQAYREIFAPQMRGYSWLGFGTHLFLLTVAAAAAPWEPRVIWAVWLLMALPMNVLCLWLVLRRRPLEARFRARLAELRAEPQDLRKN